MVNRKGSLRLGKVSHGAWEAQIPDGLDSSPTSLGAPFHYNLPARLQIKRQTKASYLIGWQQTKDSRGGWMAD